MANKWYLTAVAQTSKDKDRCSRTDNPMLLRQI